MIQIIAKLAPHVVTLYASTQVSPAFPSSQPNSAGLCPANTLHCLYSKYYQ